MFSLSFRRAGIALTMAASVAAGAVTTAAPSSALPPLNPCQALGAKTLRPGSSGPAVTNLQHCLNRLGMVVLSTTGYYGDQTKHAVITAQKVGRLSRDGMAGPATRAWLRMARPVVMPPGPNNKPVSAVVDIARQVMFLRIDGRVRVIDVSTGSETYYTNPLTGKKVLARTPRGYFMINRHFRGVRVSTAGLGEMYSPSYFNLKGHAVHGSNSVPTYPASHGCVRVTRALEAIVQKSLAIYSYIYIR